MKKMIALLLAAVCMCLSAGCGIKTAPEVKIDYGESMIYSREDIDAAIRLIEKEFRTGVWKNCELHSLTYGGNKECNEKNLKWMNDLEAANDAKERFTQCITFTGSFHSPRQYDGGGLTEDEEYAGWSWWLARSDGGKWKLMTWGYA